jgi:4-amino-4-deoxy-L-arabinose transferase-like glycosyltransferase
MQASLKKKLFIGIILLLALSRFLFPEADPAWWKSTDDIHDEAWWAENVRRMLLGEPWPGDAFARAWAVGPVTACWHWMSFKLFGINYFSLRLIAIFPSSLSILLILFKKKSGFDDNKRYQAAIILAVLPAFWSLSRIGQIEAMLSFILLLIVFLSYSNKRIIWLLIGVLMLIGVLFKFSFVYFSGALFTWFLFRGIRLKNIFRALSVIVFGGCISYVIYFYQNRLVFQPFYLYFSASFYSIEQLLDPRGWLLRLAWLPEKSFITNPLNVILITSILIRLGQGRMPNRRTGIASLLAISIVFLLGSDFSDRRLIILLIILPLALFEDHTIESSSTFRYCLAWFCGLPLFVTFSNLHLLNEGNSLNELLRIVPVFFLVYSSFFLIIKFIFAKYVSNSSLRILQITILFWIGKAIWSSASVFNELTGISFILIALILCFIIGIECYNSWLKAILYTRNLSFILLVLLGIFLISAVICNPSYTLRDSAYIIKQRCVEGNGIGSESLVELTLLGSCKPELNLDASKISIVDSSQYVWFAGLTTPLADKDSIQKLYEQNAWMISSKQTLDLQVIPVLPSPVGFREYLMISK